MPIKPLTAATPERARRMKLPHAAKSHLRAGRLHPRIERLPLSTERLHPYVKRLHLSTTRLHPLTEMQSLS
jgi:hypothetical protein